MNINTLKTLSSVYKDTGPMTTTKLIEDLLPQLLTLESRFGDLDARCFLPRHKLAHAYRAIGALEQAINLFLKNLDAKSQVLGETHFETINSQSSLANCYYALGQYSMAIPVSYTHLTLPTNREV